jgi:hypothetical protein
MDLSHLVPAFGIRGFKTYVDNFYYKNVVSVPMAFDIPIDFGPLFSESLIRIGTDYSPEGIGGMIYNSNNPDGFLVDGIMSPQERAMNHDQDSWRVNAGLGNTLLTRNVQSPGLMKFIKVSVNFVDDISQPDPPETYPGNIGAYFQNYECSKVIKGKYDLWLQYYSVPEYEPGKEAAYLNILDHPLEYSVDGVTGSNDIAGRPPRL